ncbi:ATP-grasp domain-containing protein [Nocardia blacklockiae]|uniref:ATP-grasp domain-containing protein n=1 Tax=Nocardia blacklockiae TaxID=480036 RepID=UPI00189300AA|nr:ATP-grasp domain-containing protein [Nocardia blacklockiae]MBF6170710.1 ATP-grasp domain-containing protein [Nocardia blacklockiae]
MKKVLLIGFHPGYAEVFRNWDGHVAYVLDEPEFVRRDPAAYDTPNVVEVRTAAYQQSDDAVDLAVAWHAEVGFDAVVPCWEYSVTAAGRIAAAMGLRHPGARAVSACTNKLSLRQEAAVSGIDQPRFAPVRCAADVEAFFEGRPVVLKPTSRRQSVGVVGIHDRTEIDEAWQTCTAATEPRGVVSRSLNWDYLVEEFVAGPHVSVETLVQDGNVVWENVTTLVTPAGDRRFPIMMFVVPAEVSPAQRARALKAARALVGGLDAAHGLFHSEWIIEGETPRLIECAARAPGIIPALVDKTYRFDLHRAYVQVLLGEEPQVRSAADQVAAIRYFHPPAGVIAEVHGMDRLLAHPGVLGGRLDVAAGDRVPSFEDSWSRAGQYCVVGRDHEELTAVIDEVESGLHFVMAAATEAVGGLS